MKSAVVTGASGFIGYHLVQELVKHNIYVYTVVRPESKNRWRLDSIQGIEIIELDMRHISQLRDRVSGSCDVFFHLAWGGSNENFYEQYDNIPCALQALESAKQLGCRRFICTGSQAEYGLQQGLITEATLPVPNTPYGSAKLAACHLTKSRAENLDIDWIWPRIFSVYGQFDKSSSLIPYLMRTLEDGDVPELTEAAQMWDYLYALDAVHALFLLGERGKSGEVYNLSGGDAHPLRYFTELLRTEFFSDANIAYGKKNRMIVSLHPSVQKLQEHTGWKSNFNFLDGIYDMLEMSKNKSIKI